MQILKTQLGSWRDSEMGCNCQMNQSLLQVHDITFLKGMGKKGTITDQRGEVTVKYNTAVSELAAGTTRDINRKTSNIQIESGI